MDKIATIWARVSTEGQAETSLPNQIARAKKELEAAGYTVPQDRILSVSWSSLDLFRCPQFLQLASWVRNKEIQAVGMLDRDRLHSNPPYERLAFLSECKQSGVEIVLCQGPPMIEGDWGQLMEHIHTIAKKQQVLRAKLGAKDGLYDRVVRHRKPASKHRVYGYRWKNDKLLVPDNNYETVKQILGLALKGVTYRGIVKGLMTQGILSPTGNPQWGVATISWIVRKPIYGGRYYALGMQVCEPTKRRGNTCGNSSARTVPLEQRVYLPEVKIEKPPITWEQYLNLQERVKRNQELAKRNSKRDYLLRGFVFCETHHNKNGKPRVYCGKPHHDGYIYRCPVGGCAHPTLNGPVIEEKAKEHTKWLLSLKPSEFHRYITNKFNRAETEQSLRTELSSIEEKYSKNINAETDLESRDLLGSVNSEVFKRLKAKFQTERIWIEERKEAIIGELAQLDRYTEVAITLQDTYSRLKNNLGELTNSEWRELFRVLNLEIHIRDKNNKESWDISWVEKAGKLVDWSGESVTDETEIDICFGIQLPLKEKVVQGVGNIVFKTP
jgi:DNA invertase Pin-like site-specific DNA recombinase